MPFSSFNVIPEWYRAKVQQKYRLPIEAWEAKNGKKPEDEVGLIELCGD